MSGRGDNSGAVSSGGMNNTAKIVATLLRSKATIFAVEMNTSGDVRFAVPLYPLKINQEQLLKMPMSKSNGLANFVGEFLVRKHPDRFEALMLRSDFNCQVRRSQHGNFGMWFEPTFLRFQFHISLLNQIFNSDMEVMLTHESVENQ